MRFVLTTEILEAEVTLSGLDLEGTKQVRPDSLGYFQSVAMDYAFGKAGRR